MPSLNKRYALFYWAELQGRGEFVRLALEDAGAPYTDVAREKGGMRKLQALLARSPRPLTPFAPPFVRFPDGSVLAQTAAILHRLAPELGLVPAAEPLRTQALQLQLTIADLVSEAHDAHHPLGAHLYYEDQKPEAARRAEAFVQQRIPKFLSYFEAELARVRARKPAAVLGEHSYVDLSLFQVLEGLHYAFPNAMARNATRIPRLLALRERVRARPRIAAYLRSPRRIAFNEMGIFRSYPELDAKPPRKQAPRKRAKR